MSALRSARRPLAIVFVLVLGLALAAALLGSTSHHSPPDGVRPWARAEYEALTDPARPGWPTVRTAGEPPTWTSTVDETSFEAVLTWAPGVESQVGERIDFGPSTVARPREWVTLGAGPERARLTVWGVSHAGTDHVRPEDGGGWLRDPEHLAEAERQLARGTQDGGVFARVEAEGGPVHWGGMLLFDRRTGVRLERGCTWTHDANTLRVCTNQSLLHRTPLLAVVPICHGAPREARVALRTGEHHEFGDEAHVEVVAVLPGTLDRWGGGIREVGVSVSPGKPDQRVVVLSCWPQESRHRLELRLQGAAAWSGSTWVGPFLVASLRGEGETLELRLHETSTLLLFELEAPEVLPEVDNLFDLDLGTFRAEYPHDLESRLTGLVQAEPGSLHVPSFNPVGVPLGREYEACFPMELEDATPMDVVHWIEENQGVPVGWERDTLRFTRTSEGLLDGWLRALRDLRDRWL